MGILHTYVCEHTEIHYLTVYKVPILALFVGHVLFTSTGVFL